MEPHIGYRRDSNGTIVATALGGYIYNMLMDSLKIKHVVLIPSDYVYAGTFPNGSWAGCLGMISRNVWAALLTSMLFLAILMSVPTAGGKSRISMFGDQLMDLVGNMFFESTPEPPEDSYRRWLTSFWWIAVMVVMTGFTGIMRASMMVKDQTGRISSVKDVIARPEIKPYLIDGSTYHRLFSTSNRSDHQRLWRQVQRHRSVTSAARILSKETFDDILDEKALFFCDEFMLHWTAARLYPNGVNGEFYIGTDFFINNPFTMFVRREFDRDLIKKLHLRLRWLWDAGVPQERERQITEAALRQKKNTQTTVVSTMKLVDVGAIFYLMLFGQAFACIVGLFEVLVGRLLAAATRALAQRRSTDYSPNVQAVDTRGRLSAIAAPTRVAIYITGHPTN
ncbi:hypothetical protein HPB51_014781 [Rhipicephalus microplus]|uniref:Ionotropic glutamate receptor C-terminal domain-containing protein n=1 Tax=Rhipicephalus microplus TaxID=6941 RepID=A0A9J6DNC2_RHIMP|nr:hypothetical protein HPB51_014781 [Rhipicephalus microplus]